MSTYLYHGCAAPDILDVLLFGLQPGAARRGVSLTTSRSRARWWAGLKGREVHLLRLPTPSPLHPEDAFPADPQFDFTYPSSISPTLLQIYASGSWVSLLDCFGEALSDDELADWHGRWDTPSASL